MSNENQMAMIIDNMSDPELIKALVHNRHEYAQAFLELAQAEFDRRGLQQQKLLPVYVNNDVVNCSTTAEAAALLERLFSSFDVVAYSNASEDHLVAQRCRDQVIFHYQPKDDMAHSFLAEIKNEAGSLVTDFLSLREVQPGEDSYLYDWEVLEKSDSRDLISSLASLFGESDVPYIVYDRNWLHFDAVLVIHHYVQDYQILVPAEFREAADKILEGREQVIATLFRQLEEAEEGNDRHHQLRIYQQLEKIVFDDAALLYNKGLLLMEMRDYQQAANSLVESIQLELHQTGKVEGADEAEEILENILKKLPENIAVLHCLAVLSLSTKDSDKAFQHYQKVLSIDPEDSTAHLNLGYILYENESNDTQALTHFRKFLKLAPDGEAAESVRQTLEMMGESE